MILYKAILTGAVFLSCMPLFSRIEPKHEVSLSLGLSNYINKYQYSSIRYDFLGSLFGLRYTSFFHDNFGFMTGFESSFYRGNLNREDYYLIVENLRDETGREFTFKSDIKNLSEKERRWLLKIPLLIKYQKGNMYKFYASGGINIAYIFSYYTTKATYINQAYYPKEDIHEDLGRLDNKVSKGKIIHDGDIPIILSFETGVKVMINDNLFLYPCFYTEYGMNETAGSRRQKSKNKTIYEEYIHQAQKYSSFTKPFIMGIKVKIAFAWGY